MLNSFQSPTESHIFYLFQIYSTDEFQCLKLLFNMSLKVHVDRDRGSRTVSDKDKVKSQLYLNILSNLSCSGKIFLSSQWRSPGNAEQRAEGQGRESRAGETQ